jgi:hypothetical protein
MRILTAINILAVAAVSHAFSARRKCGVLQKRVQSLASLVAVGKPSFYDLFTCVAYHKAQLSFAPV